MTNINSPYLNIDFLQYMKTMKCYINQLKSFTNIIEISFTEEDILVINDLLLESYDYIFILAKTYMIKEANHLFDLTEELTSIFQIIIKFNNAIKEKIPMNIISEYSKRLTLMYFESKLLLYFYKNESSKENINIIPIEIQNIFTESFRLCDDLNLTFIKGALKFFFSGIYFIKNNLFQAETYSKEALKLCEISLNNKDDLIHQKVASILEFLGEFSQMQSDKYSSYNYFSKAYLLFLNKCDAKANYFKCKMLNNQKVNTNTSYTNNDFKDILGSIENIKYKIVFTNLYEPFVITIALLDCDSSHNLFLNKSILFKWKKISNINNNLLYDNKFILE